MARFAIREYLGSTSVVLAISGACAIFVSVFFVASLYLLDGPTIRRYVTRSMPSESKDIMNWSRDHTGVIKIRTFAVTLNCVVAAAIVWWHESFFVPPENNGPFSERFLCDILGLRVSQPEILLCISSISLLFLGPIAEWMYFPEPSIATRIQLTLSAFAEVIGLSPDAVSLFVNTAPGSPAAVAVNRRWRSLRNYFIGPASEEFVYRVAVVRLLRVGGYSRPVIVFLLYFNFISFCANFC